MKLLEEQILSRGKALNEDVLLVDMFLNHQVDCDLMYEIGKEFARLFENDNITRVATIEASGIAPAAMTALIMKKPLVILKKSKSLILSDSTLQTEVYSFTKQSSYLLTLKSEFVNNGDRVLLIDDFLANGEAAQGAARLLNQAGASYVAMGIVICKAFQSGYKKLKDAGYHVEALAKVKEMHENYISFED